MGEDKAGVRSDFQFLAWACDTGDVSMRAEHGRGTGLERNMTSYMVDMLSLSCLWDLKGKRCVVLGKFLNLSGPRFLFCFFVMSLLPTICIAVDIQWNKTYTMLRIVLGI